MDAEQALSELGVSGVVDADSLRRAYLRKVRTHSPERDPEGFKRIRNAYDFLRHKPWLWVGSGAERFGELVTASESVSVPRPIEPPAPSHAPAAELVEHAAFEVIAAPPAREPPPAPEPAETEKGQHPPVLSQLFQKWIEIHEVQALDDPERTARGMIDLFNARLRDAETPLPAPETTFAVILTLVERDLNRTAADLLAAFEARSRLDGSSPYAFSPGTAARHKLIRELIALRGLAPKRLARLLARMIREERPLQAGSEVEDATLLVGPGFREAFAARAPTLFAAAQPFLFKPTSKSTAPQGLQRIGWWVMFAVALQVVRMIPNCSSGSRALEHASVMDRAERSRGIVPVDGFAELEKDVDAAILQRSCVTLGELWPFYATARKREDDLSPARASDMPIRRSQALAACPELSRTLRLDP